MAQKKQNKKKNFWKDNKISIIGFAILIVVIGGLFGVNGIINWVQEKREMLPSEKVKVATLKYMEMPEVQATEGAEAMATLPPSIDTTKEYEVDNLMFAYYYSNFKAQKENEMAQSGTTVNRYYWVNETVTDDNGNSLNAKEWLVDSTINQCKQQAILEDMANAAKFELSKKEKEQVKKDIDSQIEQVYGTSLKSSLGDGWNKTDEWTEMRNQIILDTTYMTYADYIDTATRVERNYKFLEQNPDMEEVAEKDIQAYYDKNREAEFTTHKVKHILLKTFDETGSNLSDKKIKKQKALAKKIAKQINNGADFDKLIKKYSEDVDAEGKVNNDGMFDLIEAEGRYEASITKYVLDYKEGDKVKVVQSSAGFHIMKVTAVEEKSFKDAKDTIKQSLLQMAIMTRAELLEAELDEGALVPYYVKLADYEETTTTTQQ